MVTVSNGVGSGKEGRMPSWHILDGIVEGVFCKQLIILVPEEWREEVWRQNKQTDRRTDRQAGCPLPGVGLLTCGAFGMRLSSVTLLALTFALSP